MTLKLTKTQLQRFKRIRTLGQMHALEPVEFERFVGWLFRQRGYRVRTTVAAGDQGVDLRLRKWRQRGIVQCKRYRGTVGQPTVRDLYGALNHSGANRAYLVTTGRISRPAEQWAAGKPIELIDGHDLVAWVNGRRRSTSAAGATTRWPRRLAFAVLAALVLLLAWNGWQRWSAPGDATGDTPALLGTPARPPGEATIVPTAVPGSPTPVLPGPTVDLRGSSSDDDPVPPGGTPVRRPKAGPEERGWPDG